MSEEYYAGDDGKYLFSNVLDYWAVVSGSLGLLFSASFVVVLDRFNLTLCSFSWQPPVFKSQNRKRLSPVITQWKTLLRGFFKKSNTTHQTTDLRNPTGCNQLRIAPRFTRYYTAAARLRLAAVVVLASLFSAASTATEEKNAATESRHSTSVSAMVVVVCVYCSTVEAARMGRPASLHSCCCC